MTTKGHGSQLPRPWYISLTAVWKDAANYPNPNDLIAALRVPSQLAGNHVLIPQHCWHFTVLAIMKLNGQPDGTQNIRVFAGRIFEPIRSDKALLGTLRGGFRPFTAKVDEVRCYDDGMVLQFECGEPLKGFRNHARTALDGPVSVLVSRHTNSEAGRRFKEEWGVELVESILDDPNRNYGTRAFGSIARSPCRSDGSTERWREQLDGVDLVFREIRLLVSDEMLTNPRSPGEEDVLVANR
jgi:hypothetical protein